MFDAGAQTTRIAQAVAHFILIVAVQLTPQKGGDVRRFDGVNEGFQEVWVKGT